MRLWTLPLGIRGWGPLRGDSGVIFRTHTRFWSFAYEVEAARNCKISVLIFWHAISTKNDRFSCVFRVVSEPLHNRGVDFLTMNFDEKSSIFDTVRRHIIAIRTPLTRNRGRGGVVTTTASCPEKDGWSRAWVRTPREALFHASHIWYQKLNSPTGVSIFLIEK